MNAVNKVALNTIILYAKMLITMGISLYSVRLVLDALGAVDYGIFNLIAGVIAMLSFLNAAMTISTQRYLSFHQGTGNFKMQKMVFSNSWVLHILIGLIIVILLELIALFLFDSFLNIPTERIPSAKLVYHFMVIAVFFTIISVPFSASLNAHENMLWIAVVNIIESVLKLGIALSISYFVFTDRLVIYALLTAGLSVVTFSLYSVFCLKKYEECNVKKYLINKRLMKELAGFAGWMLFGTLCGLGRTQGLAIILNIFFGAIINAAYAVANQISSQVNFFSATLLRAFNPQIMKSEGMNDRSRMLRLSMTTSKYCFFLLALVAIPSIFEMPYILSVWLKEVPEYTTIFCSLLLLVILTNQLTIGLQSAVQASGRIKLYQSVVGSILLLNLPISYFLLKFGMPAYSVLISSILLELVGCAFRVLIVKKIAGLSIKQFIERVILKGIFPIIILIATCWAITSYLSFDYRFVVTYLVSALLFLLAIYLVGLCQDEKKQIDNLLKKMSTSLITKKNYKIFADEKKK